MTGSSRHPALRRCLTNVDTALKLLAQPPRGPVTEIWPITWQQFAVAAAVTLAVYLLGMIAVDGPIARAVTHLPHWIVWPFDQITGYGESGWLLWPIGLAFLALAALPATLPRVAQLVVAAIMVRVGFLFVAIGLPGLFDAIIKRMIGRARPLATGAVDPYAFAPFIWHSDYASLPSGHATTAFAALIAFGTLWPRSRTAFLVYAVAIAVSRIMVSAHYPTDVVAGAGVGIVGALLVRRWFALRRLGLSIGADGTVRQWPGPSLKRIKAVARDLLSE
jgi:membrane-associated phospholipid phosphatase